MRHACPAAGVAVRTIDVDDAAPTRLDHGGHEGLGEIPRGGKLLVEKEVPVLVARLEECLVQPSRRIGDVDVDAPERVLGMPLHLFYRAEFPGRADHHERLRAERLRLTFNA